ncbi:MAG: YcgN family cysteine cluster protein [Rhodobacteraceae bacterium]|nr:YcgN family cysteine cluster protein [Paracoccaceae bacterium]
MAKPPSLRPRFWERIPLGKMTPAEWEALCDGCGKCCLNKLEDADTGEVWFTRIACRLFDDATCRCANYTIRKRIVPECVVLTPETLDDIAYWMPKSCAYRRLNEGRGLADWHPLLSGDPESVHRAGISIRGQTLGEFEIPEDDWEDYIIDEET